MLCLDWSGGRNLLDLAVIGLFAFETAYETKIGEVKKVSASWEPL